MRIKLASRPPVAYARAVRAGTRVHAADAATPRSSAYWQPTPHRSPASSPAEVAMSTGSRWTNVASAARSLRPRRARPRSSAARRPASSPSASNWQKTRRHAKARCQAPRRLVRDEPHPSCAPFGHAPWRFPVPRPNCFKANSFIHKFCGRAENPLAGATAFNDSTTSTGIRIVIVVLGRSSFRRLRNRSLRIDGFLGGRGTSC